MRRRLTAANVGGPDLLVQQVAQRDTNPIDDGRAICRRDGEPTVGFHGRIVADAFMDEHEQGNDGDPVALTNEALWNGDVQ